ncbi:extracellular solute-binding protein [Metabacillus arenae]|uniref:Extracellular solute-binding protein n=1 Tax=Metabacillus arenae TaxID=2771434 RepID=A0A926NG49_9BACI|nr:extracellular solute-binding protein [Metabacillus arenae]MBD1380666.1 extracellular solute-binding protein [Metabacillus arenae]
MKKFALIFFSIFLLIVGGCSNNSASSDKNANKNLESEEGLTGFQVSKEPVDMKIHLHHFDGQVIFNDDWATFKKAAELTNVNLKGVAPKTSTDSQEAFNLMIASGDIPDLVQGTKADLTKYGKEGAFLPLDDLIEEHAPNIKKYLEEMEGLEEFVTASDGNLYFIPFIADGEAQKGWFVRQDWLDKLGLKAPQTIEETYEVLKAFKEKDPNGNGKQDEIPYFSRISESLGDLTILWGARNDLYLDGDKIQYGPYEEKYGTALSGLAKWYEEKLIDPEIFTRGAKARDILLGNNQGGMTHDWFGSTAGYNNLLKDQVEGFKFETFAPPQNTDGEKVETTVRDPYGDKAGIAIGYSTKDPVKAIKYLDFFYTEEGRRLMNYGVEGETYDLVDGKPVFKEEILSSPDVPTTLHEYGVQTLFSYHQDFEYEKQWLNPIALKGIEEYTANNYFAEPLPPFSFTEEEEKKIIEIGADLKTYRDEMMQKWVMGAEKIDYKKFKNQLKNLGVEEYIDLHQKAYNRSIEK